VGSPNGSEDFRPVAFQNSHKNMGENHVKNDQREKYPKGDRYIVHFLYPNVNPAEPPKVPTPGEAVEVVPLAPNWEFALIPEMPFPTDPVTCITGPCAPAPVTIEVPPPVIETLVPNMIPPPI
jgi:hypothetical protein